MAIPLSRRAFLATSAVLAPAWLQRSDRAGPPAAGDLQWTDVGNWQIEGRAFGQRQAPFDRLPAAAEGVVRKEVWELSRHSAGMAVRFATDAAELHVRYRLTRSELAMAHMPATGVSGVDLYCRPPDGGIPRWAAVTRPAKQEVESRLVGGLPVSRRQWLLYLPLYNGVAQLELGVPAGAEIAALPAPTGKPIAVYGTSIAHGACASRPGMAWPAIVGRQLDREVINLGFSGNGRMEAEVGRFVCELDPAVFVVDCLPNMTAVMVAERTDPLVRQLRKARPETPILLVEDRTFGHAWLHADVSAEHQERRNALRAAFAQLQRNGVPGVHLLGGEGLLGDDDEATTDGSHPNDLGMMRQATAVLAALRTIL